MQDKVAAFNHAIGTPRGYSPEMRAAELRARLILEEAFETVEAMLGSFEANDMIEDFYAKWSNEEARSADLVEAVDGLCDLLYVVFGAFDAFGIDAEPFFQAVHNANMTKLSGPKDEHGKQLKPPGFVPPQDKIRALLIAAGWDGK